MPMELTLDGIPVDVTFKKIKNMHLKVHAPEGRVTLSVPLGMGSEDVRSFAMSRLGWIRKNREKMRARPREICYGYEEGERHFFWGIPCVLKICESPKAATVILDGDKVHLQVRPGAGRRQRAACLEAWSRMILREAALPLLAKWEARMGVKVERLFIRQMKTRWGSCNWRAGSIRLNTELVRRPVGCLEYVIVHELVHLLEPSHNARFRALMDAFLPQWKSLKVLLNQPLQAQEGMERLSVLCPGDVYSEP
ncbi:SprT family zinc-dependent metalloprotease [Desulfobotulus sp.]|jgi:predicted metal-dependent hydrolase|uniref:M48 family metallopeptidase n=1 Tax=Desulfobotulus sp. TaxID=1940337 RepID=UPI002A36D8B6|nr:SprT family zinc-dependent metalloprotease [Desulfobotulus sp.]MDY0161985.1 SprT family zinc-dependent metalloprotease [Desulfobotulus sp.]